MKNIPLQNKNGYKLEKLTQPQINAIKDPIIKNRHVIVSFLKTSNEPSSSNIIEISCMELKQGKLTGCEFHAFLHPRFRINDIIRQNTGLDTNFYKEFYNDCYRSDLQVLEKFRQFIDQATIITHGAMKEIDSINNELIYNKLPAFTSKKFFSTFDYFRQLFPSNSQRICNVSKICDFLNIFVPKSLTHTAAENCFMVAKLFNKLIEISALIKTQTQENNNNLLMKKDDLKEQTGKITLPKISRNNKASREKFKNEIEEENFDDFLEIIQNDNLFSQDIIEKSNKFEENKNSDITSETNSNSNSKNKDNINSNDSNSNGFNKLLLQLKDYVNKNE